MTVNPNRCSYTMARLQVQWIQQPCRKTNLKVYSLYIYIKSMAALTKTIQSICCVYLKISYYYHQWERLLLKWHAPLYFRHGVIPEAVKLSLSEETEAGARTLSSCSPCSLRALLFGRLHHAQQVKATGGIVNSEMISRSLLIKTFCMHHLTAA